MTAAEFQEKYKQFFEMLQTESDKEKRWKLFQSDRKNYDQFTVDLLKCILKLPDEKIQTAELEKEVIYDGKYHTTFNGVAYIQTLKSSIVSYNFNRKVPFVPYFKNLYNKKDSDKRREETDLTVKMLKLVKAIKNKQQLENEEYTAEQIIRKYAEEFEALGICKIYKAGPKGTMQLADVADKVVKYMDHYWVSLDKSDDSDDPWVEPADPETGYDDVESRENKRCIIETLRSNPVEYECYRILFTRDVMKALKLKAGKAYDSLPAGNTKVYFDLKNCIEFLWNKICHMNYIVRIIEAEPEDRAYLFGQYYNKLITEDITSPELLREAAQVPEKTVRDYSKKKYEQCRKELFRG